MARLGSIRGGISVGRRIRLSVGAVIRGIPGGSRLLRLRRECIAAARRRFRPIRPPLESPDRIPSFSQVPDDDSFITGNGIAARCRYALNYDVLTVNEHVAKNWWFCKSELIEYFFAKHASGD